MPSALTAFISRYQEYAASPISIGLAAFFFGDRSCNGAIGPRYRDEVSFLTMLRPCHPRYSNGMKTGTDGKAGARMTGAEWAGGNLTRCLKFLRS